MLLCLTLWMFVELCFCACIAGDYSVLLRGFCLIAGLVELDAELLCVLAL